MNEARPSGKIGDSSKLKPGSEEVGQPLDRKESWKNQLAGQPDGARFQSQEISLHPAAQFESVGVVEVRSSVAPIRDASLGGVVRDVRPAETPIDAGLDHMHVAYRVERRRCQPVLTGAEVEVGVFDLARPPAMEADFDPAARRPSDPPVRSEEHTSELQSLRHLVC